MKNELSSGESGCVSEAEHLDKKNNLGFTQEGLELALDLKEKYQNHLPLVVPDGDQKLLMPEHLLNVDIDLQSLEDPLPLAMVASRDPDSPMSVSAAVRMSVMSHRLLRRFLACWAKRQNTLLLSNVLDW